MCHIRLGSNGGQDSGEVRGQYPQHKADIRGAHRRQRERLAVLLQRSSDLRPRLAVLSQTGELLRHPGGPLETIGLHIYTLAIRISC